MLRRVRIGLAHHDRDLAARIADARRPPLAAVDHIMIAVALDRGFDIGRVRRCDGRLGHQERGTNLAVHQRLQPLLFVLLGAVAHEHFHIAGVRRGAVEHFRRPADMAHLFRQQRVFEIAQSRAVEFVILMRRRWHEHVPQAFGLGLLLQFLDDRDDLPALACLILLAIDRHGRADMLGHEGGHALEPFALAVRHREIHGTFLFVSSKSLAALLSRRCRSASEKCARNVARLSRRNAHRGGDGMTRNVAALRLPNDAGAH